MFSSRQSPLKRKHNEYHDPDYPQDKEQLIEDDDEDDVQPGCSKDSGNKKRKCKEEIKSEKKAGNDYLQKVCDIIEREFQQEILLKQQQLDEIDDRLGKAKNLLDKLRYGIVAAYYNKQELPLTSADAMALRRTQTLFGREDKGPQMPLHPSLKKLIGKRPKDLSEVVRTCSKRTAAQNAVQTIRSKSQAQKREERKLKQIIREQGIVIDHSKQGVEDNDVHTLLNVVQKNITQPTNLQQKTSSIEAGKIPSGKALNASRLNNKIKHLIVVGNTSKFIGSEQERDLKNQTQNLTHKWLVYVQAKDRKQPLERFVKKIRFFLHHSYRPNDVIDIQSPPFQVARRGWGEFPIRVQLFFHSEYHQKPVQLVHNIILDQTMSGIQTLGAETLLEIWLRDRNPMDPPKKEEIKIIKKPIVPQKPKPCLISHSEHLVDDNLLEFLNKIESSPCSISADIEKIQPTVVVTEPLAVKTPSPVKGKVITNLQQKSPEKTVTSIKSPEKAEKSLNELPPLIKISSTSSTTNTTINQIPIRTTPHFKKPIFANGSLVSKPMTTYVKLPPNSTQFKFIGSSSPATTHTMSNIPPLRPITPSIKSSAHQPLSTTLPKSTVIANKDGKILMPSASVASAVKKTILPIITKTITAPTISTSACSTNLSFSPKPQVVTSIASSSSAPKQILQKKLVQLVDSTGKVKYMQMLVAASSASSSVYNFNQNVSSVAPKLITTAPSCVKNNTVTNTTQITKTITTPILKSVNGLSLTPAPTMKPNIFKIIPESIQTKPQILTFNTNTQAIITNTITTTTQQHQPLQQVNKTIGTITTTQISCKSNNLTIPVANKLQKSNGINTTNIPTATKNVVFQKEGKLYIIDPLQMKLKQQQKKQVSLLKPQVSLLKRQQKPMPPPPLQQQQPSMKTVNDSKLNIAATSSIQMPSSNKAAPVQYGQKLQRVKPINALQLQQMKRIIFEKQFFRQEFTNIQTAVEFLLRRLMLIVPKDSLQSAFPFVCHSLQEFQCLTAFKQRAYEWLRAKNISRMLRNHKVLQNLNKKSKETFWSTKEIATFARQYAYTPIIKSLPHPGQAQDDENSQRFEDLVKSELKQEQNLQYDTLTDHQRVSKWVDKAWRTLEDQEQQEEQHQIIDIDTIQEYRQLGKKPSSLNLQSSSSSGLISPLSLDVYLQPPAQLENQCQLVSDICKDLNIKLMPEELEANIYHPSSQTVLAQCLHIFLEKVLRQSIALKQRKPPSSSSSSSATEDNSICNLLPQDLAKALASSIDFDFLTNNNFGSTSLAECLVSSVKQEKS